MVVTNVQIVWINGPFFCISILKPRRTKIFRHSVDFNAFCMIQKSFSDTSEFSTIKDWGINLLGEPILQKVWLICYPLLDINCKSFQDVYYSWFITFQWIFSGWGVPFRNFWIFYTLKIGHLTSGVGAGGGGRILFNFKTFKDLNSESFIRVQCVLYDSQKLLLDFWKVYKLKRAGN